MAVKIGDVWDQTTDVLAGRAGLLTPVAALAFFLPAVVQSAVGAYAAQTIGGAAVGVVVGLIGLVAALWGSLTVIGIASHPDTTRQAAGQAAARRLGPALLVSLVLGAAAILAVLPIGIAMAAAGFDFRAAARGPGGGASGPIAPGAALFVLLYSLVLLVAGLWIGARLAVLSPVILRERRGIGAIGRSFVLTRGLTLKLIGVIVLLAIVWSVAALAAQYVVFVPLRLILGPANQATATWLGGIASAAVSAVFSTMAAVFTARLYAAIASARAPQAA